MGSGRFLGGGVDLFAGLFHLRFEGFAGFLPGLVIKRNAAFARALATILPGVIAAAALALASIGSAAAMRGIGAAVAGSGAGVVLALTLPFAGVESAADMFFTQEQRGIMFGVGGAALESGAEENPGESGGGELAEVAAVEPG